MRKSDLAVLKFLKSVPGLGDKKAEAILRLSTDPVTLLNSPSPADSFSVIPGITRSMAIKIAMAWEKQKQLVEQEIMAVQ